MDFLKLVRARYSVRQYQNRPVEPEKVEQLLEAAQAAPTAACRAAGKDSPRVSPARSRSG